MSQTGVVTLFVTCPDSTTADTLAETLVQERLAACVTLLPGATSVYRWEGRLERSSEVVALFKTTAGASHQAIARIKALHPHDVPCITAWPVDNGHAPYLRWVRDQTI